MEDHGLNWVGFLIFVLLLIFYYFWGNARITKQRKANYSRFNEFETSLASNLQEYTCFANNHPYVWGEVSYHETKKEILESPRWEYSVGGGYYPARGWSYCFKVNEENKYLYVVTGSETFDWESLCHYEVWKNRKVIYY